ncbi:DUF4156 domain-containing protein [Variovorax sp. ZS18.2.2]|uniref:DUF4156 domain-containing protein n=1 Tax=Variovorax sp. ZS18.2.2 TaxID=2971255 RepID=UPI0021517175|nr:DUF4156 domain-containing protein [Variovorax sp. ZS18.2.2]MCR6481004.1 DUF4156 domain-containing protein [Variovorax sp. ZS18.2.2]
MNSRNLARSPVRSFERHFVGRLALALPVLAVLGLSGCASTAVTPQGASVELVTQKPPGCRLLGEAIGSQGNAFSGDFTSNNNLLQGARNDLRNKAAAMGGNVAQIQNALNATHPYSSGAISSSVVANVYACPRK